MCKTTKDPAVAGWLGHRAGLLAFSHHGKMSCPRSGVTAVLFSLLIFSFTPARSSVGGGKGAICSIAARDHRSVAAAATQST